LGALAAQLLHARSDHRKVVSGAGSGALAAQLLHACPDHRKIVSGAWSGHVSSIFFVILMLVSRPRQIGSIRLGSCVFQVIDVHAH
jgi:hypothetical protein